MLCGASPGKKDWSLSAVLGPKGENFLNKFVKRYERQTALSAGSGKNMQNVPIKLYEIIPTLLQAHNQDRQLVFLAINAQNGPHLKVSLI